MTGQKDDEISDQDIQDAVIQSLRYVNAGFLIFDFSRSAKKSADNTPHLCPEPEIITSFDFGYDYFSVFINPGEINWMRKGADYTYTEDLDKILGKIIERYNVNFVESHLDFETNVLEIRFSDIYPDDRKLALGFLRRISYAYQRYAVLETAARYMGLSSGVKNAVAIGKTRPDTKDVKYLQFRGLIFERLTEEDESFRPYEALSAFLNQFKKCTGTDYTPEYNNERGILMGDKNRKGHEIDTEYSKHFDLCEELEKQRQQNDQSGKDGPAPSTD